MFISIQFKNIREQLKQDFHWNLIDSRRPILIGNGIEIGVRSLRNLYIKNCATHREYNINFIERAYLWSAIKSLVTQTREIRRENEKLL